MKAYSITLDDCIAIYKLAEKHGKKQGDSMQEEFEEYFKDKKLKLVGEYPDKDMLKANLREQGYFKILDLSRED